MYINPFLAGVLATIITELILIIAVALFRSNDKDKEE